MNETTKQIEKEKYIVLDIETTGLNPWYGDRITCICAKDNKGNRFEIVDESEFNIIDQFMVWLCKLKFHLEIDKYMFLTKNGKQFDIPFILLLRRVLFKYKDDDILDLLRCKHFDLQEVTTKRISLQSMAELLNTTPKSETGENAIKLWETKEYDKLKEYCSQDVDTTEEVYLKWKSLR